MWRQKVLLKKINVGLPLHRDRGRYRRAGRWRVLLRWCLEGLRIGEKLVGV